MDDVADDEANGEDDEAHEPKWDELAENELVFFDGCDVELLDGADLFFFHDIEGGEEAADHGE